MKLFLPLTAAALISTSLCQPALAQELQQSIPFAGNALTISQQEEYGEKTLSFAGGKLVSAYVIYFDQIARLGDADVALFDIGEGGNACGPAKLMIWQDEAGDIQRASIGEDTCGAPVTAIASDWLYFVPWLTPGTSGVVQRWTPQGGFATAGKLTYAPEAGTTWTDIDLAKLDMMLDVFSNEAVYDRAKELLGNRLEEMATSLMVSAVPELTPSGVIYGNGCIPHACGSYDGFMAVDPLHEKLYFARQTDVGKPETWPSADNWPADVHEAMEKALISAE